LVVGNRALLGRSVVMALVLTGAASAQTEGPTALTLSGVPSMPLEARSMRLDADPVVIRFRAPVSAALETLYLALRGGGRCTVALRAATGAELARADTVARGGWQPVPLAAALEAGAAYDVAVQCEPGTPSRLAYVLEPLGETPPPWELVGSTPSARPRFARSPLFALAFADGRGWGQPYRARRQLLRPCGGDEIGVVLRPRTAVSVAGLRVRVAGGPPVELGWRLEEQDGGPLLAGTAVAGRRTAAIAPALVPEPVLLSPGTTYRLRLTAGERQCLRLAGLLSDLDVGPPVHGLEVLDVVASQDGGRTWATKRARTLAGLEVILASPPTATTSSTTSSTVVTTTVSTTSVSSSTVPSTSSTSSSTTSTSVGPSTSTTTTSSSTSSSSSSTSTTTVPASAARSIYASGYFGIYDSRTVSAWPPKLGVILGEANAQGPLVENARKAANAAGNTDVRFIFYFSLTSIDAKCGCFDAAFYNSITSAHPEWFLRDASGNRLSTFVYQIGAQRQFAVDIGNPAFVDAWADWALAAMDRWGWDGVWADNILRGNFDGWSGWPVNPRTGARYTTADYRRDMLAAMQQLRRRFDARGKLVVGNHASAYDPATFADPVVQQTLLAMHGTEIEDCVYTFSGTAHSESNWIGQLRYLDFANRRGIMTQCRGGNGTIGDPSKRDYILASYLLTKRGVSNVAQLNNVNSWWSGLEADLGAPTSDFRCLDPGAGLRETSSCPSTGKVYVREWERGRVLVNPTAGTTVTVPLGGTFLRNGNAVTSVTLGPRSGAVLLRR
jgi:hypothetical protein